MEKFSYTIVILYFCASLKQDSHFWVPARNITNWNRIFHETNSCILQ